MSASFRHIALIAGLSLGGCMMGDGIAGDAPGGATPAMKARAPLVDKAGASVGQASLSQESGGLRLRIEASGLTPGEHGLHIHTVGRCDAPDFTTAGAHWNPTGMVHGKDAPGGPHQGDLPNITAGADGRAKLDTLAAGAQLAGLMDADGAALVIHASADDYRTDPSGNSGGRVICGVFAPG